MFIIGRNSDLDLEVAMVVFKIDPDCFRWGVPFFSVDRNAVAMVNLEMADRMDGTREKYEKALELIAIKRGWKSKPEWSGVSMLWAFLLPEEICHAAIIACQLGIDEEVPLDIDKNLRELPSAYQDNFPTDRSETT